MGLIDDLDANVPAETISRRELISKGIAALFAVAGIGTTITTIRFLRPTVLFEPPTRFALGRPESISVGSVLVLEKEKLYVVRDPRGFFALSAVCTHLGCMTRFDRATEQIACPCHGSFFDKNGVVIGGPAPRQLDRKLLTVESGQLVVDLRKDVPPDFILQVPA